MARYAEVANGGGAASIVADRVCGAVADPIIRNEQEKRQLRAIERYLKDCGYKRVMAKEVEDFRKLSPGCFSWYLNVSAAITADRNVSIPIDVVVMRKNAERGELPLLYRMQIGRRFYQHEQTSKRGSTKNHTTAEYLRRWRGICSVPLRLF